MRFLNFDRVLCLSPHPDDTEYSMAGIVLKYKDTKFDIFCLTKGGDCDDTTSDYRLDEVVDAWNITGANNYSLHFSDIKLLKQYGIDEWVNYIEHNFTSKYSYDCIMTTSEQDSHFEHGIVSSLAAPLSRIKPYSIIQYRSPSTLETWIPNLFVSIDEFYNLKRDMISQFKSQVGKSYFSDEVFSGFHTNFQCMKKDRGFVESYKIITMYE